MKKLSIIALVVLAGASWACRKNVAEPENPYADAPWAIDESLPVPIQFGLDDSTPFGIETKAAPIETANFADAKLKITAVDLSAEANYATITSKGFLFYDAPATVSGGFIQFQNANRTAAISRYYPQVSSAEDRLNYSFIGYQIPDVEIKDPANTYPPTTRTFYLKPNKEGNNDFNVDILWARADASTLTYLGVDYEGFNAQYIRKARLADELAVRRPNLAFTHKAAVVHFIVRGENLPNATDETYTYGNNLPIYTVKDLKVAVRREVALLDMKTGSLTSSGGVYNSFRTYDSFAGYSENYVVPVENGATSDGTEFGTGVFIIPGARTAGTDDLKIQFTLVNNVTGETDTYGVTTPILLPLPYIGGDSQNGTGYDAGKAYTYYITVKSATEIKIQASVAAWSSYTGEYVGDEIILG